jgi:hypothetical protein
MLCCTAIFCLKIIRTFERLQLDGSIILYQWTVGQLEKQWMVP